MYVITFYSFKGGVGRTFALVNVAAELARMGRRVLLVDFDLEAPGLETFDRMRPREPHLGVVEYVKEYLSSKQSPDVRDYVYPVEALGDKGGHLWVMPAGRRDSKYQFALASIDWKRLYHDCQGYWFFEDTKKQWEEAFQPDYVLIDSRTGHTDVEGICTRQLPDAVVVLFVPNEQNLVGLKDVCRRIRDERDRGLKKTIRLHFVMSNVPDLDDEDKVLRRRLDAFHKELGIDRLADVIHRYESVMLFNQAIFVLDRPRSRLAREYRRLVRTLIKDNSVDRAGSVLYLRGLERARSLRNDWRYTRAVKDRLKEIESRFSSDPEILLQLARWFQGQGDLGAALQHFDRVITLKPAWQDLLLDRGRCRRQTGNKEGAAADLFLYLHSLPEVSDEQERLFNLEENIVTALEELFNAASLPTFLKALTAPVLGGSWILHNSALSSWCETPAASLIREQRWKDAIRYLDIGNAPPKDVKLAFLNFRGQRRFYLAMAQWGETGTLSPDLCWDAEDHVPSTGAANFQRLSLLYWGAGKKGAALGNLDDALATLETPRGFPVISCWTFREASVREFRQHCDEQRRMICGEPVRPTFLGEAADLRKVGGKES